MATNNYSTTWTNANTAGFQAWGSALASAMQACGLTKTTDTGQINWSTVAVPTTNNTSAGYEIYKFTDALQATSPIFLKIEYGTGPNQTGGGNGYPQLWLTVGTATDGAGNLTGTTTTRSNLMCNYNASGGITSSTTPYPTYVSFDGSYLGIVHKIGGLSTYNGGGYTGGAVFVGRPTDNTGAYVGGAVIQINQPTSPSSTTVAMVMQCLNTSSNTLYTNSNGYFTLIPMSMTATAIAGGNYQIFPCYGITPQVYGLNWLAYGLNAETAQGNTVSATILGSTAHTYLMTGAASYGAGVPSSSNYSLLMKYE